MSRDMVLRLADCLSHEETRSGEAIAEQLSCTRTAVWKHVRALKELGVAIEAEAGHGYRLAAPLELLFEQRIGQRLHDEAMPGLNKLEILTRVDSTNTRIRSMPNEQQHGTAVFAECQQAGRGRHGREWVSPFGANIYLSLGWRFSMGVSELGCLPLLVAISACKALDECGIEGHGIKWPNDLLLAGMKLGGCLVEVQGDAGGPCQAVMGIGINVRMSEEAGSVIDQPWTDVASHSPGISRNDLAGSLLNALLVNVQLFESGGFAPFMDQWEKRDLLQGNEITLTYSSGEVRGQVLGISDRGGLLLQSSSGQTEYMAGEVSLRK